MIRKIFKWIGIVLGSLVGLLVLAFVVLYVIGTFQWNKLHGKYEVPVETIPIPTDQASIERGQHIATTRICMPRLVFAWNATQRTGAVSSTAYRAW
jgi:hypothetical protein